MLSGPGRLPMPACVEHVAFVANWTSSSIAALPSNSRSCRLLHRLARGRVGISLRRFREYDPARRGLILGRQGELGVLRDAVGDARVGRGRIVLIEGEAGIGKTCLVDACLAELADGFQVLRTRAHELDRHRPFGAFVEPLTPRRDQAASEAVEFARLLNGEQPRADLHLVHEPGARVHVPEAILAALERMWMSRSPMLAVEDVQWADPESLTCLYHLARRVSVAPVVVLLTYRPSPHLPELEALIGSLLGLGAPAMALGPLDGQTVSDLAAHVLGVPPGATLTRRLGRAGGNPLFVTALLQALREEGVLEVREGRVEGLRDIVPPSLRLIILRMLAVLSEPCVEVLRLASIRVDEAERLAREVLADPHDRSVDAALRLVLTRALTLGGLNAEAVRHVEAALGTDRSPSRSAQSSWPGGRWRCFPSIPAWRRPGRGRRRSPRRQHPPAGAPHAGGHSGPHRLGAPACHPISRDCG
jgi:hypothetical protein